MKVFDQLLESVRTNCPDLITEEQAAQMVKEFDQEMDQVKADNLQAGQAAGFREGYDQGKKVAKDEMKAKLDEMVEKLDEESCAKLEQVIEMVDQANAEKLQQLYDWMKTNMVPKAELDNALQAQDEDYADKFETALQAQDEKYAAQLQMAMEAIDNKRTKQLKFIYESIDKKHAQMIAEAVETIDKQNASKLNKLVNVMKSNREKAIKLASEEVARNAKKTLRKKSILFQQNLKAHKVELEKERNRKIDVLAEAVQKYINYALESTLPKKQLISEAKYNAALKTIEKVTDVLKVNSIVQESREGLFADYEAKIANGKSEQEKLINENIELKNKLDKMEAQIVLEEKCKGCTPAEAKFVKAYFSRATNASVIEESINEAKAAFKKLQSERRESLIQENAKRVNSVPTAVVTEKQMNTAKAKAKSRIVSESKAVKPVEKKSVKPAKPVDVIDLYANALKPKF